MNNLLKEYYAAVHGDFEGTRARLGSEKMIQKFLLKMKGANYYAALQAAYDAKESKGVFEAAHNLKGVSANLGLLPLYEISNKVCELFRHGWPENETEADVVLLKKVYDEIMEQMTRLEE